jgi:hypothetical protein
MSLSPSGKLVKIVELEFREKALLASKITLLGFAGLDTRPLPEKEICLKHLPI